MSYTPVIDPATRDFIRRHLTDDVSSLALRRQGTEGVDMSVALTQIAGWQRARTKLPRLAALDGIVYPPHLSLEQCSGEAAAVYKRRFVVPGGTMADLTGGFGIDFSYMAQGARQAVYVERQQHLCDIARHNLPLLGLPDAVVVCCEAEDFIAKAEADGTAFDLIYIDPARRDTHGRKTYAIEDCTPDVARLMPRLLSLAPRVVVKLSPMLDHTAALRSLGSVSEVHILSVKNECKETLIVVERAASQPTLFCINDGTVFTTAALPLAAAPVAGAALLPRLAVCDAATPVRLFVPNASVMKAGCFGAMCGRFGLAALDRDTRLFVEKENENNNGNKGENCDKTDDFDSFPGKIYNICCATSFNRRELKAALAGIGRATVSTRNFPLSPDEVRRKLRPVVTLRDGGTTHLFATTVLGKKMLLVAEPAVP